MTVMTIKTIDSKDKLYQDSLAIRDFVLRKPIGMDIADDDLSKEVDAIHFLGYIDNQCVATLYLKPFGENSVQMKQVAVHPFYQGQGLGRKLIQEAEKISKIQGKNKVMLHARINAWKFYEKLGYQFVSDEFVEIGIRHKIMEKVLK